MQPKRLLGRILVDGGFLSDQDLNLALHEQTRTSELLGQVLARMGVLDAAEINAVLSIQEHLGSPESAVRLAAGVRKTLGSLLVQAGQLSPEELKRALAEQRRTGGKLGEILVLRGVLSEKQLANLLYFQRRQERAEEHPSRLRLGEILVSTGHITREQLDEALRKHKTSGKKLGEILVEEGYVEPCHVSSGLRIQRMLLTSALVAALSLGGMSGCGSERSGQADIAASNIQPKMPVENAPDELDLSSCEHTLANGMRIIHVPAGVYTVARTIELPSDTVLEGEGDATVLTMSASFTGPLFITNEDFAGGNKNLALRNMQIRFAAPQFNGNTMGLLFFYNVEDLVISDITMAVDASIFAIDLSGGVRNATIEGCTIRNVNAQSGGGIRVRNSDSRPEQATSNIIIRSNTITSVSDEPIAVSGWEGLVENIRIEDNIVHATGASFGITACGHIGPEEGGQIKGVEIVDNVIEGSKHGAIGVMGGAQDVIISGNQVGGTEADGIFFHRGGDGALPVRNVKVMQNSIRNAGRHGIFADGADVRVERNVVEFCTGSGVFAASGVTAFDNVVK